MKTSKQHNNVNGSIRYIALFLVCMISIVGCTKDPDRSANTNTDIETIEYVVPTEDMMTVKSSLQSYISPNVLTEGFGGALRNRLTNHISAIDEDNIEFILTTVIHNSDVQSMTSDVDLLAMLATQLLVGRNIIIVEPTLDGIDIFSTTLSLVFDAIVNDPKGQELLEELEREAVPGARQVIEVFHEMSLDKSKISALFALDSDTTGVLAEALAIRGSTFHIVERMSKDVIESSTTCEVVDENGESSTIEDFESIVGINSITDSKISAYSYGLAADMLTSWINDCEYYMDEYEESSQRSLYDIRKASENKLSLDEVANVQKVEYTMNVASPYNVGATLPVVVRFEICSIYMDNEDCDYYCVYKTIRSYNQVLECGPNDEYEWKLSPNFEYLEQDESGREYFKKIPFYGPFMREISGKSICYAATNDINNSSSHIVELPNADNITPQLGISVMEYAPKNSIGSTDHYCGISYGFDGGLSFGSETSWNLGMSISYDKSTSQTIDDLEIKASTKSGIPTWQYIGNNLPGTHLGWSSNSHDIVPSIMSEECEVNQSWIWRVQNPTGSYCLYDETQVTTCILSCELGFFWTYEIYNDRTTTKRISFLMLPPPRYEQCWIRDVQPYSEAVNNLLGTLHSRFWNTNNYEIMIPDTSPDSDISINQFINDFKSDLQDKKMIWHNRGLIPEGNKYTFSFYKKGTATEITFEFEL